MESFHSQREPNMLFGVYSAIVVDNVDPDERFRVKVKFPWMPGSSAADGIQTTWARVAMRMAGKEMGEHILPEVDDEVLVAFMHGDFRDPIIVGSLHNGVDKPYWQTKTDKGVQIAKKNNLRGWRSRSGHMIAFVDNGKSSAEKIVLQTKVKNTNVYDQPVLGASKSPEKAQGGSVSVDVPDGSNGTHVICMDMTSGKEHILICDKDGKLLIKLDSKAQTMILYSEKDMVINAKENLFIKCKALTVESVQDTKMKAGGKWNQEATGAMTVKTSATMNTESSGTMTVKGSVINLN